MVQAVLLHPHPDRGGNQFNPVVTALYDRLNATKIRAHRFDFSSADEMTARAEAVQQIEACAGPVWLIGYSFGGAVAATIAHPAVIGWGLIAPALTLMAPVVGTDPRPKHLVLGRLDPWFGPAVIDPLTNDWVNTTCEVTAADHFFGGPAAGEAAGRMVDRVSGASA